MDDLRRGCATVAQRARAVRVRDDAIEAYAASLPGYEPNPEQQPQRPDREQLTAFWLTLDAINFGSGWFPTLAKRPGMSGYQTIAAGLRERFDHAGPWTAAQLAQIDTATISPVLGQRPEHELMVLFAASLRDLGRQLEDRHGGSFAAVVDAAGSSAVALARRLGGWPCFADSSTYDELELPFLKRAQIAAADLQRAGVAAFVDLHRLTMFADNLVPHVLRLDGVLEFEPQLVARIERGELLEHGSPEEVEIRACAVHGVELLVAAGGDLSAAQLDQLLWLRGQDAYYKAVPRHRCRCTSY